MTREQRQPNDRVLDNDGNWEQFVLEMEEFENEEIKEAFPTDDTPSPMH